MKKKKLEKKNKKEDNQMEKFMQIEVIISESLKVIFPNYKAGSIVGGTMAL